MLYMNSNDLWNSGILLYEMLYGRTPFRGKNRQKTFGNILHKDLTFPSSIPVILKENSLVYVYSSTGQGLFFLVGAEELCSGCFTC